MLENIKQSCQSYYNDISANSLRAIAQSGAFSFIATLIILAKPSQPFPLARGIQTATISMLAATIHSLTTPLFNYLFNNKDFKCYQECARFIFDLALTDALIKTFTGQRVLISQPLPGFSLVSTQLPKMGLDFFFRLFEMFDPPREGNYRPREAIRTTLGIDLCTNQTPLFIAI